jgi:riboflavin kinase/FMN adenylyltransferase
VLLTSDMDDDLAAAGRPTVATIGVFDGVHVGHQRLVGEVVARAQQLRCVSAVVTFEPHPAAVLAGSAPPLLTSPEERERLLHDLGVDVVVLVPFTRELADQSARGFLEHVIRNIWIRELWVGPDFALGRDREGDPARLAALGKQMGFAVWVARPRLVDGIVVSSTRIRLALAEGDVSRAAALLGRRFACRGIAVPFKARGVSAVRIATDPSLALPAPGLYACRAGVGDPDDNVWLPAVVRVPQVSLKGAGAWSLLVRLPGCGGNLAGVAVKVEFLERLGPRWSPRKAEDARRIVAALPVGEEED